MHTCGKMPAGPRLCDFLKPVHNIRDARAPKAMGSPTTVTWKARLCSG